MTLLITFAEGDRVEARMRGHVISTDQDDSAVSPFDLFLASIGTCAGIYVSRFCRRRGIDPREVGIEQRVITDPETRMVTRVELDIRLPEGFPERYLEAVKKAAALCSVKKHLEMPPAIDVRTVVPTSASR